MTTEQIESMLKSTRADIEGIDAPSLPGVYAIFLASGATLPLGGIARDGLVYVGMSRDLASREFDTHFASGSTGFSTLRRSIGAVLKDKLNLVAIRRGSSNIPSNFQNYRFTSDGESKLTAWMEHNLEIGTCPLSDPDYANQESALISRLQPVLNLTGWPNPQAAYIKRLRKVCADEARLSV